jgi:TRAP-type C4-dicarboxylate transport system permease large subunit
MNVSYTNNNVLVTIARASLPFFFIMLLATVLITVFPDIALYLPNRMIGK